MFLEQPPQEIPIQPIWFGYRERWQNMSARKSWIATVEGKLYRARQGEIFWTSVPYGYQHIPRQGNGPAQVVIHDAEADVVRRMFRWHADESMSIR